MNEKDFRECTELEWKFLGFVVTRPFTSQSVMISEPPRFVSSFSDGEGEVFAYVELGFKKRFFVLKTLYGELSGLLKLLYEERNEYKHFAMKVSGLTNIEEVNSELSHLRMRLEFMHEVERELRKK